MLSALNLVQEKGISPGLVSLVVNNLNAEGPRGQVVRQTNFPLRKGAGQLREIYYHHQRIWKCPARCCVYIPNSPSRPRR